MGINYSAIPVVKTFRARQAIGIFSAFILAMLLTSICVSFLVTQIIGSQSATSSVTGADLIMQHLVSLGVATYVALCLLKSYFPGFTRKRVLEEIGFVKSSTRLNICAALFGVCFSLFFARILGPIFPPGEGFVSNPLMTETQTGDWIQYLTAFTVVLIGPAVEEFLYRGVLYKGFSKSWGAYWAGLLVSVVFIVLHNETLAGGYWLSILALILNTVLLQVLLVSSGSIIPSIFMHMGLNFALVLPV